jgi:alkylhydroperoxidase/carboxymuconolactone decarboxylase family protein YurZ
VTVTTTNTPTVASLDPLFAQMGTATARHSWAVPELTDREKVFLAVTADICQSAFGQPFQMHVTRGLRLGVSTADIRALIRLISYDTGYHAAAAAIERLVEIEAAAGITAPETPLLDDALVSTGPDAAQSPLPEPIRAQLLELDAHFTEHFELQSRMRLPSGPGTLSVRERAFSTMSIDIHYQTLDETFQIHVSRALGGGASPEDVRAVLRFSAQWGVTRAWRAWKALNAQLTPA